MLDHFDQEHLVGRLFVVPLASDEQLKDNVATLYY